MTPLAWPVVSHALAPLVVATVASTAGGVFDPLGLASGDDDKTRRLKEAEIKHGRLAMVAFLGT